MRMQRMYVCMYVYLSMYACGYVCIMMWCQSITMWREISRLETISNVKNNGIYIETCVYVYVNICMYMCMSEKHGKKWVYTCACIWIYVYMYACVCTMMHRLKSINSVENSGMYT